MTLFLTANFGFLPPARLNVLPKLKWASKLFMRIDTVNN